MNTRWTIIVLAGFVAVVAALWGYLAGTDSDDFAPSIRPGAGAFDDRGLADARPLETPEQPPLDGAARSVRDQRMKRMAARRKQALRRLIATTVSHLDDVSVRVRASLSEKPFFQLAFGLMDAHAGRHDAALRHFARALERVPDEPAIRSARAASLIAMGRLDDAARAYEHVLARSPRDPTALYNDGVLLVRRSRFHEAAERFRRLVRCDPRHARGYYNLASLAQRAGRIGEAREAWRAFTRLRPEVYDGWFNLGVVLMDFHDPAEAAACFSRAIGLEGRDPNGYVNLGLAYLADGDAEAALDVMQTADALSPCDPVIRRRLAVVHESLARRGGEQAAYHRRQAAQILGETAGAMKASTDSAYLAGDWNRDIP